MDYLIDILLKLKHGLNPELNAYTYLSIFVALLFGNFFNVAFDINKKKLFSANQTIIRNDNLHEFSKKQAILEFQWLRLGENLLGVFLVCSCILFLFYFIDFVNLDNTINAVTIIGFKFYSHIVLVYVIYLLIKNFIVKNIEDEFNNNNYSVNFITEINIKKSK